MGSEVDEKVLVQATEEMKRRDEILAAMKEVQEKLDEPMFAPYIRKSSLRVLMNLIKEQNEKIERLCDDVMGLAIELAKAEDE